ncbi:hypothetical protein [Methylobacterium nigriterrae]|uniref:hypothetical protein n=1 Tax=Methylobacterium nigriterrae TaxID=3127512 RepID=UPI003013B69A
MAIKLALAGDASALRLCLHRLAVLRRDRPIAFTLPEVNGPEDVPTATYALLRAVASGEITPAEATALGKLIDTHIQALELTDVDKRLRALEGTDVL